MKPLLLLCIVFAAGCGKSHDRDGLEVTYIANEGYMVSMDGTKVLIDALPLSKYYANPSDPLAAKIIGGVPPYDNVDYFLVTHEHTDHFNAALASLFLQNHPLTMLLANPETCRQLNADSALPGRFSRLALKPGDRQTIHGEKAEITALRLEHGGWPGMTNLAYIVRSNGCTIVHVGDAKLAHNEETLRSVDWKTNHVNVLFMEYFDQSTPTWDFVETTMKPDHVVLMHVPPGEEDSVRVENEKLHPGSIVFAQEGERRSFDLH
jgi:L-ascorbate metabolism protein UlaG (beta-lactamase superfamily)